MKNFIYGFAHVLVIVSILSQSWAMAANGQPPQPPENSQQVRQQSEPSEAEAQKIADETLLNTFRTNPQAVLTSSENVYKIAQLLLANFETRSAELKEQISKAQLGNATDSNTKGNVALTFEVTQKTQIDIFKSLSQDIENMEKLMSRGINFFSVHNELTAMITNRLIAYDQLFQNATLFGGISVDLLKNTKLAGLTYESTDELLKKLDAGDTSIALTPQMREALKLSRADAARIRNEMSIQFNLLKQLLDAQMKQQNPEKGIFTAQNIEHLGFVERALSSLISIDYTGKFNKHDVLRILVKAQEYLAHISREIAQNNASIAPRLLSDAAFQNAISDTLRTSVVDMILKLPADLYTDVKNFIFEIQKHFNELVTALERRDASRSSLLQAFYDATVKIENAFKRTFSANPPQDELLVEKDRPQRMSELEGRDFWKTVDNVLNRLRRQHYQPYKEDKNNPESKVVHPLEVNLVTPANSDVISMTDTDVETLANKDFLRAYMQGQVTETAKNLIVNIKPTRDNPGKVERAEATTEIDPQTQQKHMLLKLTGSDQNEVMFRYVLDPELASKTVKPLFADYFNNVRQEISTKKPLKSTLYRFPFEMLAFNAGVFVNSWINVLMRYENDPMAVERTINEWLSFPGMMSFFGFMLGNQFSQILMSQVARGKISKVMVPWISMGFGALASNIMGDLLAITRPCAEAMMKRDDMNPGDLTQICQKAFDEVVNHNMIHRYIQTSITVTASSTLLGIGQLGAGWAIGQAANKSITINGLVGVVNAGMQKTNPELLRYVFKPETVMKLGRMGISMTPWGLATMTVHLVAFFQMDHLLNPYIHKFEETWFNSGTKFVHANNDMHRAIRNLSDRKFQNHCNFEQDIDGPKYRGQRPMIGESPGFVMRYVDMCKEIPVLAKRYKETSMKWSDTLMYQFNMAFYSWQEFYSQFIAQRDIAQKFYNDLTSLIFYQDNPMIYNPMFQDDPLYGVIPVVEDKKDSDSIFSSLFETPEHFGGMTERPEEILIEKTFLQVEDEHFIENKDKNPGMQYIDREKYDNARFKRIRQAAFVMQEDIKKLSQEMSSMDQKAQGIIRDYIVELEKIKSDFLDPKALNGDFSTVQRGLLKLKNNYDRFKVTGEKWVEVSVSMAGYYVDLKDTKKANALIEKSNREIYNFIGRPKPLKAGEGFMVRFNDWVIQNYGLSSTIDPQVAQVENIFKNSYQWAWGVLFPDVIGHILTKYGDTPAETMLYHAICGRQLADPIANYYREISDRINAIDGGEPSKINLRTPRRSYILGLIPLKDGTGVDLIVPRIVDARISPPKVRHEKYGTATGIIQPAQDLCERGKAYYSEAITATVPAVMRTWDFNHKKGEYNIPAEPPQTKTFKTTLDFVSNAISSQIFTKDKNTFTDWWGKTVSPAIDEVFDYYDEAYFKLIDTKFKKALFGEKELPEDRKEAAEFIRTDKMERTSKGLPNAAASIWVQNVNTYLNSMIRAYIYLQEKELERIKSDKQKAMFAKIMSGILGSERERQEVLGFMKLFSQPVSLTNFASTVRNALNTISLFKNDPELRQYLIKLEDDAMKRQSDVYRFQYNAEKIRELTSQMIEDMHYSMNPNYSSSLDDGSSRTESFDLTPKYGPILVHLQLMMGALGLNVDPEHGINYYNHLFEVLDFEKKYQMDVTENAGSGILALWASNIELTQVMAGHAQQIEKDDLLSNRFRMSSDVLMLAQTITNKSAPISSSERNVAELAYMASTHLFSALNDIYNKTTIFKAASAKNTFQEFNLELIKDKRKGTAGSTGFGG